MTDGVDGSADVQLQGGLIYKRKKKQKNKKTKKQKKLSQGWQIKELTLKTTKEDNSNSI